LTATKPSLKPRYSADRPNKPPEPDLLGRDPFAARLASDISGWQGHDSLVIALYGSWGCGKTSLKERVLWHLRNKDPSYPVLDFNPWQFSGSGNLGLLFLRELDTILKSGKAGEKSEKASKTLARYARHLSFAGVAAKFIAPLFATQNPEVAATISMAAEGARQIGAATQQASDALKDDVEDKTLAEIKKSLSETMAELDRSILVVIDDIDRLNDAEILEIFQLIKINADFPRLIYLVLFDRPVVCEALDKAASKRGKQYLEKIVQVAYHIPEAPKDKIRDFLFKGIDQCFEGTGALSRWEQERWSTLYLDGMAAYFTNLRHINRFLASLDFQVRHFQRDGGFEVNPVDLLGLETLRLFESDLYETLFSNKPLLTGDYGLGLWSDKKETEIVKAAEKLRSITAEGTRSFAHNITKTLFPPILGTGRDAYSREEWLKQARVCHPEIFDKYFTLQLGSSDLGQVELEQLIGLAGDREKFTAALKEIERRGLIRKAMDRFEAYKDQVPLESMLSLITALCDCADSFPERTPGFFEFDPLTHAWRIVYFGLRREPDANNRFKILDRAIQETNGLALPVRLVSGEERRKDSDATEREYIISEHQVPQLKAICVDKLQAAAKSGGLKSITHGAVLLWRWSEWESVETVRKWVTAECEKNGATAWLLSVLTSEGAVNGKPFYFLTWSTLERFVDPDVIERHVADLDQSTLNEREQIGLQQYRRALKRKKAGKADLTGHEWKDDE
jgi:predicted KAP-like P-loop ATPase